MLILGIFNLLAALAIASNLLAGVVPSDLPNSNNLYLTVNLASKSNCFPAAPVSIYIEGSDCVNNFLK